jgi:PEP-CTERM motif
MMPIRVAFGAISLAVVSFGSTVSYTENPFAVGGCGSPAYAVNGTCAVVVDAVNNPETFGYSIPQVSTSGAQMNGMTVTVTFSDGFNETLTWATIGPASLGTGGVSDTSVQHGFTLTETGDTYTPANPTGIWTLMNNGNGGRTITDIVLNGTAGSAANCPAGTPPGVLCGTIFDRTSFPSLSPPDNEQTPGSHQGFDWQVDGGNATGTFGLGITYSNEFALTSTTACNTTGATGNEPTSGPCLDEWSQVAIHFTTAFAPNASLNFDLDSDNAFLSSIPEPSSFILLAVGLLAGAGYAARRKRLTPAFAARRA